MVEAAWTSAVRRTGLDVPMKRVTGHPLVEFGLYVKLYVKLKSVLLVCPSPNTSKQAIKNSVIWFYGEPFFLTQSGHHVS
jgi:hypothetical protein